MYDYATWNMYERIVNARRQRLSWLDAQQKQVGLDASSAVDTLSGGVESTFKPGVESDLHKVHSREDSSMTASTVDDVESDKSSATLSSASSSVSTASLSNDLKRTMFNLGAIKDIKAIHPETAQGHHNEEGEGDEHFIFEMDM
jgi:hypothetical protein